MIHHRVHIFLPYKNLHNIKQFKFFKVDISDKNAFDKLGWTPKRNLEDYIKTIL